jgi:hypothetical protein
MHTKRLTTIAALVLACGAVLACNSSSSGDDDTGAGGDTGSAGTSSSSGGSDSGLGGADEGTAGANEGACEVDATYMPEIDPTNFVEGVDNRYWPLPVGTTWVFDGSEYIEVTVTDMSKEVMGIPVVVVRDTVRDGPDGEIIEDTFDWYAQDTDGNVWYMGEDTKEYAAGAVVSTEGSWEAGVDGAQPGIVMHAMPPDPGEPYRQEYYACEAEDFAEIISTTEMVSVTFGDYEDCIQTREFTPLEPDVNEYKYYCADVGLVLQEDLDTGESVQLIDMTVP